MNTRAVTMSITVPLALVIAIVPLFASAQGTPPSTAAPYQFQNEGIFGCNQIAGANASAGTMAAIGGVYVPVNDAAVTLNSGILVYKECVLRPLQDRLRESAMSALFKKNYVGVETGRDGNKRYVVDPGDEELIVSDKVTLVILTDGTYDAINPAFRETVRRAVAANWQAETRSNKNLECDYNGDLRADITDPTGRPFVPENFEMLRDPACNEFFVYQMAREERDARIAQALEYQRMQWDWGRGFYSVTDNAEDPLAEKILTPAATVQESYQTVLDSPVHQLESANDIGQMIGALFAGVTTQALTDSGGLAGLAQGAAGQPSYLDQVARESSQGVIGAAVNAALTILNASRQIETRYLAAMNAIASTLTQAINQLRNAERACWNLVIPAAQAYAQCPNPTPGPPGVVSCGTSFQIQPATSTAFSQQVIDSQIRSLAQAAATNVQNSQRALGLIDQLIAGVTNTASLNAQRLALQQLDNLVAQRQLHTQYDAQNAEQQKEDIVTAMGGLVTDTVTAWGDSPDPGIGWCNVNNPDIPRLWAERWRI